MNKYIDRFISYIQVIKLSTQWIHESMPQKAKFQKYITDTRKVLFKSCSMYVSVGRERKNSIQQKRG